MHMLHGFACKIMNFPYPAAPALVRPAHLRAPALKAPPEAGRRGGESIARGVFNLLWEVKSNQRLHMVVTRR